MGEPIKIGHHSEKRHRAAIAKVDNTMRRAFEHHDMAKHHSQKAAGLEDQLDGSIFSDDPDAIERLEERIAELEAEQEQRKAINKIVRSKPRNEATPEKIEALKALGMSEAAAAKTFEPDFCGRIGIPSYALRNNNSNIRRLKLRMGDIKRRQARQQRADDAGGMVIEKSADGTSCQVTFSEKPDWSVIKELKASGFHWRGGSWFGSTENLPACVEELAASEE